MSKASRKPELLTPPGRSGGRAIAQVPNKPERRTSQSDSGSATRLGQRACARTATPNPIQPETLTVLAGQSALPAPMPMPMPMLVLVLVLVLMPTLMPRIQPD